MPHTHPVLIAEDDEDVVFFLQRIFRKQGIQNPLKFVPDGQQALDYLETETRPPRVALLDIKMPVKDGFDVLKRVRAHPKLSRLPVVMFSNSREERDVNRAYDLGANSYVVKPSGAVEMEDFVGKLHDYWINVNEMPTLPE